MVDTLKILGALLSGGQMSQGSGTSVLQSVLGAVISGANSQPGQADSGLGGLLSSVLGGSQQGGAQPGGSLGDMLGSVLGGASKEASSGGLGDLLGGVLGGTPPGGGASGSSGQASSLESLLAAALNQFGQSQLAAQGEVQPRNFEEHSTGKAHDEDREQATLMIRAMVNAAKSDGRVDQQEQERIFGKLGHVTRDEMDFLRREIAQPLDVDAFVRGIPPGMGNQVYVMSLMAVDLDSNREAQYLHKLAQGLHLSPETVNQVHKQLGAPLLYS